MHIQSMVTGRLDVENRHLSSMQRGSIGVKLVAICHLPESFKVENFDQFKVQSSKSFQVLLDTFYLSSHLPLKSRFYNLPFNAIRSKRLNLKDYAKSVSSHSLGFLIIIMLSRRVCMCVFYHL